MIEVAKLLGKSGKLTGAEVGNLVIKDLVYRLVNKTNNGIFTEAEIDIAINSLNDSNEIKAYNKRSGIASFLNDLNQRCMYGDLMLSKKLVDINYFIRESRKATEVYEIKEPLRLTYDEYEAYKKEKLETYYKENNEQHSLFELVLYYIQQLYQKEEKTVTKIIDEYIGKPLTDEEKSFYIGYYGKDYKETTKSNFKERWDRAKDLLEQGEYKEALFIVALKQETIIKEPYDKSDFIYNLAEYWDYVKQTKTKFNAIVKQHKDLLTYCLQVLDKEHFNGKFKDIKLDDTLKETFTKKELAEKYGFTFYKEALEEKPVILSTYGSEETVDEIGRRHTKIFLKIMTPEIYKVMFELYDEVLTFLKNINKLYDLLAEDTGVAEIKQLKYDTTVAESDINASYVSLLDLFLAIETLDECEEVKPIKLALDKLQDLNLNSKEVTKEKINKAKELLNSSKKFKEYQTELFSLFSGN